MKTQNLAKQIFRIRIESSNQAIRSKIRCSISSNGMPTTLIIEGKAKYQLVLVQRMKFIGPTSNYLKQK